PAMQPQASARGLEACASFTHHVWLILLILTADEFDKVGPELQMEFLNRGRPRPAERFRIVNGSPHLHVAEIDAPETLGDAKRFRGGAAFFRIQPRLAVETRGFHH